MRSLFLFLISVLISILIKLNCLSMLLFTNHLSKLSRFLLILLIIIQNSESIKNVSNYQKTIECECFSNSTEKNRLKIK